MKRFAYAIVALFLLVVAMPGCHIVGNSFLHLTEPEYAVPEASSYATFDCTKMSEGGNTSYCNFGKDWSSYFAACGMHGANCTADYASFPKSAAKDCSGFDPHDASTWCNNTR